MKCNYPNGCRHQLLGETDSGSMAICNKEGQCGWKDTENEIVDKVQMHEDICQQLTEIYKRKNSDYGDSFAKVRNELGEKVILVRLMDKLERLKTLLNGNEQRVNDESILDTFGDLANYAILEMIEIKLDGGKENE